MRIELDERDRAGFFVERLEQRLGDRMIPAEGDAMLEFFCLLRDGIQTFFHAAKGEIEVAAIGYVELGGAAPIENVFAVIKQAAGGAYRVRARTRTGTVAG